MSEKKKTRNNWLYALSLLIVIGATASYYLLYGPKGVLLATLNPQQPGLKWLVSICLRYGLSILRDAGIFWVLGLLYRQIPKVSDAVSFWVWAIFSGAAVAVFSYVINVPITKVALYQQLFPVTNNGTPLIIGGVCLLLVHPYLRRFARDKRVQWLLLAALWVPLLFNTDPFLFNQGDQGLSLIAILWMGMLAANTVRTQNKHQWLQALWVIGGIASVLVMFAIEYYGGIGFSRASRFIGVMSPFTILPAMALTRLFIGRKATDRKVSSSEATAALTLISLTMIIGTNSFSAFSSSWMTQIKGHLTSLGIFWLVVAVIALLALALVTTVVAVFITRHFLSGIADSFLAAPLAQVIDHAQNWRQVLKQFWRRYGRGISAVIVLLIVQMISALLMNDSLIVTDNIWQSDRTLNIFSFMLSQLFARQVVGTLILLAGYWVILALTNRYWVSLISVSAFGLFFAVANRIKINLRAEPIVATDLAELKQASEILSMISTKVVIAAIVVLVALVTLIVWRERRGPSAQQSWWVRGAKLLVSGAFIFSLGSLNHATNPTHVAFEQFGVDMMNINPQRYAQWYGPVLQFITGLDTKTMATPTGYSKATVTKLVKKYQQVAANMNKTRTNTTKNTTVIFNLSESFSDPTELSNVKVDHDPIPYIHQLEKETTSGKMMSFGYGGGTANMEYMTLTGTSIGAFDTTLNTPYTQLVPGLASAPNIGEDWGYSAAIHPYSGGFYNREAVYRKFDFNKFAYLGSKYKIYDQKKLGTSPYLSDTTAYDNALHQLAHHRSAQFMNLITIQNHLPFSDWYLNNSYQVTATKSGAFTDKTSVDTYVEGIHYTDQAVKAFKESIDKINRPIVWVFYGDHLPGIYNTFGNDLEKYETTYFVYANKYARAHGALTKQSHAAYAGSNDFISLALRQGNIKVNAYNALLSKVQADLPAQWMKEANSRENPLTGESFVDENGKRVSYSSLTKKQQALYRDYQMITYDINAGKQYSLKAGIKK